MEQDTKAAKKSRDRAQAAAAGGVGLLQSFFFNKKATPAAPPTPVNPAATPRVGQRSDGSRDAGSSGGKLSPTAPGKGSREGAHKLIEQAVPNDFAGRSWDGYLHHVKFLVALLHVGTSLMPKNLIKVCSGGGSSGGCLSRGGGEGKGCVFFPLLSRLEVVMVAVMSVVCCCFGGYPLKTRKSSLSKS